MTWLILAALIAHLGAGVALLITFSAGLHPGLWRLALVYAATPRLSALPMAAVAWQRAGRAGRAHAGFRQWFSTGFAALAAESAVHAWVAIEGSGPPLPAVSATLTMATAGCCWAFALGEAKAASRGSADGPDLWDRRDAAATMWWTAGISIAVARLIAPLAVAFVLRLG